jgi:hypothetical protein
MKKSEWKQIEALRSNSKIKVADILMKMLLTSKFVGDDRTLVFGKFQGVDYHTYIKGGRVYTVAYDPMKDYLLAHYEDPTLPIAIAGKHFYPEYCDGPFLLELAKSGIDFKSYGWQDLEVRNIPFTGKTLEELDSGESLGVDADQEV